MAALLAPWPPPGAAGVLLVIAHPDDESMFFAPAVTAAVRAGARVRLLCLSTGDADGLGRARAKEIRAAARVLGLDGEADVTVLDHPRLRDGMREHWDHEVVAEAVRAELAAISASESGGSGTRAAARAAATARRGGGGNGGGGGERAATQGQASGWAVLTFDSWGVSGHPNHRDTSAGVLRLVAARGGGGGSGDGGASVVSAGSSGSGSGSGSMHSAWRLRSEPLLVKFLGPAGALIGVLLAAAIRLAGRSLPIAVVPALPVPVRASLRAMRAHGSQWVWFRWLFVALSCYGWLNVLERV